MATYRPQSPQLRAVRVVFVPTAVAANTYANLCQVGTTCQMGDDTYIRLSDLRYDRYYPGGRFLAMDKQGNISGAQTVSDIGRLDYAFNDYLNFLMAVRLIYESDSLPDQKVIDVDTLAKETGAQGHSLSIFIDKHGGARALLKKCRGHHSGSR